MYANVNRTICSHRCMFFVYTKTLHSLLLEFLHESRFHLRFCFFNFKVSEPSFSYSKRYTDKFHMINLFNINLTYLNFTNY